MFNLNNILRPNIQKLTPYSSARSEFKGNASVWLDANESPWNDGLNRYPDPLQKDIKNILAPIKAVNTENIFLGNGSDEAIDLLLRAFCEPNQDYILTCPPTYGMYQVSADINAVGIKEVPLDNEFSLDVNGILNAINKRIKIIFICSPNNPTGNLQSLKNIENILHNFNGIVVVDEAYIDFAPEGTAISLINKYPNLVVMQTFSKAWGLAGIRLGMAFAQKEIIDIFNKIKPPYNVNILTQKIALEKLQEAEKVQDKINQILDEKRNLIQALNQFEFIYHIFPSDSNFILIQAENPKELYKNLVQKGIVIRDRTKYIKDGLRITIGTKEENKIILEELSKIRIGESI